MATLSVIVPATNAPETLDVCLAAMSNADESPAEVIVVDDASATSPAAARNAGVASASGDVIVFVDADVAVHADVFTRIRTAFEADPELVALFGSYDDDPPETDAVSGFRNLLHHHVHQSAGGDAKTFWAGLGAIRRSAFERFGGFVEHPVEDIELGMRLHAAGARMRLDPTIRGAHLKRWTFGTMIRTDLLVRGAPWVGLLLRHRSAAVGLNLGWRHRLSALAVLTIIVATALLAPFVVAAAFAALLALNASFYRLLVRRRGVRQALVGVALHVVHHVVSVGALVVGVVLYATRRRHHEKPDGMPVESPVA